MIDMEQRHTRLDLLRRLLEAPHAPGVLTIPKPDAKSSATGLLAIVNIVLRIITTQPVTVRPQ